jgi:hypothetical protein
MYSSFCKSFSSKEGLALILRSMNSLRAIPRRDLKCARACCDCFGQVFCHVAPGRDLQSETRPILVRAITKKAFSAPRRLMDLIVCFSIPCVMWTTRIAMTQREELRERRSEKDSFPGMSMMRRPGSLYSSLYFWVKKRVMRPLTG